MPPRRPWATQLLPHSRSARRPPDQARASGAWTCSTARAPPAWKPRGGSATPLAFSVDRTALLSDRTGSAPMTRSTPVRRQSAWPGWTSRRTPIWPDISIRSTAGTTGAGSLSGDLPDDVLKGQRTVEPFGSTSTASRRASSNARRGVATPSPASARPPFPLTDTPPTRCLAADGRTARQGYAALRAEPSAATCRPQQAHSTARFTVTTLAALTLTHVLLVSFHRGDRPPLTRGAGHPQRQCGLPLRRRLAG